PLPTFIKIDHRGMAAPTALDVMIEGVISQVRLSADEPLERRRSPIQHTVPLAKPRELLGCASPKCVGVFLTFIDPLLHRRIDQTHCSLQKLRIWRYEFRVAFYPVYGWRFGRHRCLADRCRAVGHIFGHISSFGAVRARMRTSREWARYYRPRGFCYAG